MPASSRNALAAIAAGMVIAGCTGPQADQHQATPAEPPPPVAAPAPADEPPTGEPDSPTSAARAWLAAYHYANWREQPTAWIDRVQPYVTARLHRRNASLRGGHTGVDWQRFVQYQCVTAATDIDAVIPPEAPRTRTTVNVQVAGTLATNCAYGQPEQPRQPIAATIVTVKSHGQWRVDELLY